MQPDNYAINLGLAVMYIQNSMKRQTDNRQYGIAQGLSFLHRYHAIRTAGGEAALVQEAEYNVARTYHLLGTVNLAIAGYEKVLALSEQVQAEAGNEREGEVEDFAPEAAMALQSMFALAGNYDAANAITEEWLVM